MKDRTKHVSVSYITFRDVRFLKVFFGINFSELFERSLKTKKCKYISILEGHFNKIFEHIFLN